MSHVTRAGAVLTALAVSVTPPAIAHHRRSPSRLELPGRYVTAAIEIDGRRAPLYPAPDGSGRYYFEAARDASYVVHLANRGHERLGIRLSVDGLNVIDGLRLADDDSPGRLYILGPRGNMTVRGWRTSLREVRRFTFVDEERSYAARTGQADGKLGWIELAVYRERRRADGIGRLDDDARPTAGDAAAAAPPAARREGAEKSVAREAFPGTGWGGRAHDPARLVSFEAEALPVQRGVLRYEYRDALLALGIRLGSSPDRLAQRERGEPGFAQPPARER